MVKTALNQQLNALWQSRYFITSSIRNEFISRVVRSRLGLLWVVLYPLAQVAIYAFVLSVVLSAKLPGLDQPYAYPLFLTAGMLAWSLFAEILSRSLTLFIENGNLLKKMVFPRLALPLVLTGSALLNNSLLLGAVLLIFALLGHWPGASLCWLPLLTALLLLLSCSAGLLLGLLNVFVRDIGQVVGILLQFGFWLTPVVYSLDLLGPALRPWLLVNPLAGLVLGYQQVLVYGHPPQLLLLVWPALAALLLAGLAVFVYRRAIDEVVDVL